MENQEFEQKYIDGYNNGYLLSRFEPALYKQISSQCDKEQPYFQGMIEGHRAHEQELFLKNLEHSRQLRQQMKPKRR